MKGLCFWSYELLGLWGSQLDLHWSLAWIVSHHWLRSYQGFHCLFLSHCSAFRKLITWLEYLPPLHLDLGLKCAFWKWVTAWQMGKINPHLLKKFLLMHHHVQSYSYLNFTHPVMFQRPLHHRCLFSLLQGSQVFSQVLSSPSCTLTGTFLSLFVEGWVSCFRYYWLSDLNISYNTLLHSDILRSPSSLLPVASCRSPIPWFLSIQVLFLLLPILWGHHHFCNIAFSLSYSITFFFHWLATLVFFYIYWCTYLPNVSFVQRVILGTSQNTKE